MASSSAVTTDTWKGQLDFDKACTSTGALDRCWLIADLTAWNRVLHELECALFEFCPGKLSLRHLPHGEVNEPSSVVARKAAFLISWLVEHHTCIAELRLWCIGCPDDGVPEEAAVPIRLRPPPGKGIRSLEVQMFDFNAPNRPSHYYLYKEDIEALRGIEELKIFSCDSRLEPALVRLVEHNSDSLKAVEAVNAKRSRSMVDALQRLKKCESVTVGLRDSDDDAFSDTDAVTGLAQGMVGVKKLSILLPGNSDCKISGLARAVEASVTLTTLELAMFSERSSPVELFAALKVNTSVKMVRVHFISLDASCEEALAEALSTNCSLIDLNLHGAVNDGCMIRMAGALKRNTVLEKLLLSVAVEGVNGVKALCEALRTNKTLKKLEFPAFEASQTERTITTFRLSVIPMELGQFDEVLAPGAFAEVMSHGLVMNPVILEFGGAAGYKFSRTCYQIFETLSRNRAALNRATDFVLLHGEDRVAAQAFQLFFGKACLVEHVMKTSGKSEREALLAIVSAQNFLLDNYFVITRIVQRSVECYPADNGTQCDELDADCWRAIARHLKVVDVLS
ncbi:hypothetical protein V5799_023326 [Amblyomma americanum]|uniref:Ran gtpase-activating protein n=1 Tax=Amblyomma americanum TaxID=6943 RepID=A0AAQ4FJF7_AMBAM